MPIIYGAIGYSILKNNKNNLIIFADMHDELIECANYVEISDWFEDKFKSSEILLEEVERTHTELLELWKSSKHTQKLKKLYLNNKNIKPIDIRPIMINFSWEILDSEENDYLKSIKNVLLIKYLYIINDFFCLKNDYLIKNLENYKIDKLKNTSLGLHFLKIKKKFKILVKKYKEYLFLKINVIFKKYNYILENINNILDDIMEWYTCAKIMLSIKKSIIIHTGLYHSENIINLLIEYYDYIIFKQEGINYLKDIDKIKDGCLCLPEKIDNLFN